MFPFKNAFPALALYMYKLYMCIFCVTLYLLAIFKPSHRVTSNIFCEKKILTMSEPNNGAAKKKRGRPKKVAPAHLKEEPKTRKSSAGSTSQRTSKELTPESAEQDKRTIATRAKRRGSTGSQSATNSSSFVDLKTAAAGSQKKEIAKTKAATKPQSGRKDIQLLPTALSTTLGSFPAPAAPELTDSQNPEPDRSSIDSSPTRGGEETINPAPIISTDPTHGEAIKAVFLSVSKSISQEIQAKEHRQENIGSIANTPAESAPQVQSKILEALATTQFHPTPNGKSIVIMPSGKQPTPAAKLAKSLNSKQARPSPNAPPRQSPNSTLPPPRPQSFARPLEETIKPNTARVVPPRSYEDIRKSKPYKSFARR